MIHEPTTVRTFVHDAKRHGVPCSVAYDVGIPLAEHQSPDELFGHLVQQQKVLVPFQEEIRIAFHEFCAKETQKFYDDQAEEALKATLEREDFLDLDGADISTLFISDRTQPEEAETATFDEYFQFVMRNATPDQLSTIISKETKMSEEMAALIRARDFEMDRLTRACETAVQESSTDDDNIDEHSYNLSMLNEKLRQVNTNYCHQIQALCDRQRREYREMITKLYETDELPPNVRAETPPASLIRRSVSMPATAAALKAHAPQVQDESFTIYIGAQMKTMHNARVLRCDRLTDLCQTPLGEAPHAADTELFDSRRLQLLMSLYGSNLTSVVLLVGRDPLYHLLNRTLFARMCEQSAELHFDSLEQQLHALAKEVSRAKYHCRRRSRTSSSTEDPKNATRSYDEGMLKPGDVYVTCHSNLTGVQVVFHLVADKVLETDDISSRHPCIAGLRNIIKLSSRCAVRTITLPLFLVEAMTESMTVGWCMTRAELVFKCLKGFLMEVCSTGASSSTTGGPTSPAIHYNINFALPSKLSDNLFKQIVELLSTIFHLVPSVTAQTWP